MDWRQLDSLIEELERLIKERKSLFSSTSTFVSTPTSLAGFERHDWRPVWAKSSEIQAAFKSNIMYPTKSDRDRAWVRFNDLRNESSALANDEREKMSRSSEYHRSQIIELAKGAYYSPVTDAMFFFDPTTVSEMKHKSLILKQAGELLSASKLKMLREHKDECFAYINQMRESHKLFWEARGQAVAARKQQFDDRRDQIVAKLERNLEGNRERLAKAQTALERVEANIDQLREQISSARSDDFRQRAERWLSEAYEKQESIQESVRRAREWIEQDESRLRDIYSRNK